MSDLRAPNVMLIGPSGAGKTYSLHTLVAAGVLPFVIFTEPGYEVLDDIPDEKLHWRYIPPASASWDTLMNTAKILSAFSNDALQKMEGVEKNKYTQFMDVIAAMNNFKCDRCGKEFGDVATWTAERAIVIDGLTGLGNMGMDLGVGNKALKTQPDWGKGMDFIERFLGTMCNNTKCWFILIAHVEREKDEITGGESIFASAPGRKLAPKLPRMFSEVVLARRTGESFEWSTAAPNVDTKARNLKIKDKLPPDFGAIKLAWEARRKVSAPST